MKDLAPPEPDAPTATKPDLIECLQRGYVRSDEDLPELSMYGWAMAHMDHDPDDWDEERIHLSDYKYALEPSEGGCERQLWHRLRQDARKETSLWEQMMWTQGHNLEMIACWLICHGLPDEWGLMELQMDVSEGLPRDHIGSCDLVLEAGQSIMGVELKTMRGRAFHYMDGPRENHVLQSQAETYALRRLFPNREVSHQLLYLDREGQNGALAFDVWEDDVRIEDIADEIDSMYLDAMHTDYQPPNPLDPTIKVSENKGPNSIYLEQPWMCRYCSYYEESCPGALSSDLTGHKIVAKGDHEDAVSYPDRLDWKVNGEIGAKIETAVARAVQAGNVKSK